MKADANPTSETAEAIRYFQPLADLEAEEMAGVVDQHREVGMMVSLSHSIWFHRPGEVRADEWLLSEMESPWAGDGRGLVRARWWDRRGRLVATCVQEVSFPWVCSGVWLMLVGCYAFKGRWGRCWERTWSEGEKTMMLRSW